MTTKPWLTISRSRMRLQPAIGLTLLLVCSGAGAVNLERGRSLYENHCQACHTTMLHQREGGKVKTLQDLRRRVAAWGDHAGEAWGGPEIDDVTAYLDNAFYHLTPRPR